MQAEATLWFGWGGVVSGCRQKQRCDLAGVVWYPDAGRSNVVVWLGWCSIRMQAEAVLQPAYGHHTTPAKPQHNTNTHRTRAIQPMK